MAQFSILVLSTLSLFYSTLVSCNPSITKNTEIEKSATSFNIYLEAFATNNIDTKNAIKDLKASLSYFSNISWVNKLEESNYLIQLNLDTNLEILNNLECYNIRANQKSVKIEGKGDLAIINGIYTYLELLNFHWYFPGEAWHTKPKSNIFELQSLDIKNDCPKFLVRKMSYTYSLGKQKQILSEYNTWKFRNKMNGIYQTNSGHSYKTIVPKSMYTDKPDWFALVNGKRSKRGQLCLSNQELQNHAKKWIKRFIIEKPHLDIISVSPNDGGRWCSCQYCNALGNNTDRAVFFANLLGKEIEIEYPSKYIRLNAYLGTAEPGLLDVNDNVIIYIATKYTKYKLHELAELWNQKAKHFGIREYHNIGVGPKDLPQDKIDHYQSSILAINSSNFWVYQTQAGDQWIPSGLDYFLTSKILWHPDTNLSSHKEKFFTNAFGEAKDLMKAYYALYGKAKTLDQETIQSMISLIDQASKINKSTIVNTRIQMYKIYLIWLNKFYSIDTLVKNERISQSKECLELVWRSRNNHIFHAVGHFNRYDKYYPSLKELEKKEINKIKAQASKKGELEATEVDLLFNKLAFPPLTNSRNATSKNQNIKPRSKKRSSFSEIEFRSNNTFLFVKNNNFNSLAITTKNIKDGIIRLNISSLTKGDNETKIDLKYDHLESNIGLILDTLENGIYQLQIEANWLTYKFQNSENIFWLVSSETPGTFEKSLNAYVHIQNNNSSLKVHMKASQKIRPEVDLYNSNGDILFQGNESIRLGYTYNIPLDSKKEETINLRVNKNGKINFFYLSGVLPILSFDGSFKSLKPFMELLESEN